MRTLVVTLSLQSSWPNPGNIAADPKLANQQSNKIPLAIHRPKRSPVTGHSRLFEPTWFKSLPTITKCCTQAVDPQSAPKEDIPGSRRPPKIAQTIPSFTKSYLEYGPKGFRGWRSLVDFLRGWTGFSIREPGLLRPLKDCKLALGCLRQADLTVGSG